ncbi:MFS transporter [Amycolatopsis minnesotensis]|uniref:MFS transporter n=1 Tax=Amycolatopsis minnesotensis TaxID=337894 RepID=A0ABN2RMQ9_9PSEU
MSDILPSVGTWRELLGRRYLGAMVVLAGGVALYATNVYLTTSLLPSAIAEIGGERFYAWNTTVFLLTSVASSVLVSRLLSATTSRGAYLVALGAFTAGTVVCALAPHMAVLLVGRAVQGAGGGLVAGLGYAVIRSALPSRLWARGTALISAMWGVGTFAGPVLGGWFANIGAWRWAFAALAAASLLLGALVPKVLAATRPETRREAFPFASLALLSGAALVVSVASLASSPLVGGLGVVAGMGLVAGFAVHERRTPARILPGATYARGSALPWLYATIAPLAIGSTTETFVPLFGQRLAGLGPLVAGFLGAALALGWTLGEIPSAAATRPATVRRVLVAGPVVLTAGLALTAALQEGSAWLWAVALLIAGSGIGMAWPHLATSAMRSVGSGAASGSDSGSASGSEGDKASAAINTVQLVANAFGASLTGLLVNLGGEDTLRSARYLFWGFAALAILAVATSRRGAHRSHPDDV